MVRRELYDGTPSYPATERHRTIKEFAREVYRVSLDLMAENGWSSTPLGDNFARQLFLPTAATLVPLSYLAESGQPKGKEASLKLLLLENVTDFNEEDGMTNAQHMFGLFLTLSERLKFLTQEEGARNNPRATVSGWEKGVTRTIKIKHSTKPFEIRFYSKHNTLDSETPTNSSIVLQYYKPKQKKPKSNL